MVVTRGTRTYEVEVMDNYKPILVLVIVPTYLQGQQDHLIADPSPLLYVVYDHHLQG